MLKKNQDPGLLKRVKRSFHGNEFPAVMSKALEQGENNHIHQTLASINLCPKQLKEFLQAVFTENREYKLKYKMQRFFSSEEKPIGDQIIFFKRYIILTVYRFIIDNINENKSIPQELLHYLQKLINLLEDKSSPSIENLVNGMNLIKKSSEEALNEQRKNMFDWLKNSNEDKNSVNEELDNVFNKVEALSVIVNHAIETARGEKVQGFMAITNLIPPLELMLDGLKNFVGIKTSANIQNNLVAGPGNGNGAAV